jgi:hypothetical protein
VTTHHRPANVPDTAVTFFNIFEVSADHLDACITEWEQRAALLSTKPGFIDSRLHRAHRSDTRFQLVNGRCCSDIDFVGTLRTAAGGH